MMAKSLIVVGSINRDIVVEAERFPLAGETVIGNNVSEFDGGKGANQALGIARLGAPVILLGHVGEDTYGSQLKDALQKSGVQTEWIETVPGPSGTALITHTTNGENNIVVVAGANALVSPDYLERSRVLLAQARMILTQLEIPLDAVEAAAKMAVSFGIPFMLDPAPARQLSDSLLRSVTWLTPNETEAAALIADASKSATEPQEMAAALLALGPRNVALKLGRRGVFLAGRDVEPLMIQAWKVTARDTTAAGDTFNAAFAVRLAAADSPQDAANYACAAAAISVTRMGAQASMPTADEVTTMFTSNDAY
jgi:ribokinase